MERLPPSIAALRPRAMLVAAVQWYLREVQVGDASAREILAGLRRAGFSGRLPTHLRQFTARLQRALVGPGHVVREKKGGAWYYRLPARPRPRAPAPQDSALHFRKKQSLEANPDGLHPFLTPPPVNFTCQFSKTRRSPAGTKPAGLACDMCSEKFPAEVVRNALKRGHLPCSCGNDLTRAAREFLGALGE